PREGALTELLTGDDEQTDHRGQHDQAAEQRVEEELHRRVLPPRPPEAPDEEVHRYEHGLEQHVEQEDVGGGEHAHQRGLGGEQQREVPGVAAVFGELLLPGEQQQPRQEERGESDEDQRDAVDPEREPGAERGDPVDGVLELEPRAGRGGGYRVGEVHHDREHELGERHAHRHQLRGGRLAAQRVEADRAREGEQDQRRQEHVAAVHTNLTASRAATTTTAPPSIVSAYERTKPVCSLRNRPELPPNAAAAPLTTPS